MNEFKNKLFGVLCEKDVENVYRAELLKFDKNFTINSPYGSDGVLGINGHSVLLEFKKNAQLSEKISQNKVLIQVLYYLKKFELDGAQLPDAIFVGDVQSCFVLHVNKLFPYLNRDLDWEIAPSDAPNKNPDLLADMCEDNSLLPFLFEIDSEFKLGVIIDELKKCCTGEIKKVKVTEKNFTAIFEEFQTKVLKTKTKSILALNPNERANLFLQLLINPIDTYPHPNKKTTLVTKSFGEVKVNMDEYYRMFSQFESKDYTENEKRLLTSIADRIIEEDSRRFNGEFFTPPIYVNFAHKRIEEVFGVNWKDEYVVWDCCCGLANLSRDYNFKELYLSTLHGADVKTIQQMKYNSNATLFQFDFLNDDDSKLPKTLLDALRQKKMLFLINPPYASSGNASSPTLQTKGGVSYTHIRTQMMEEEHGVSSQNLYAQFMFRIMKYVEANNNIQLALFSPVSYLMNESFHKFHEYCSTIFHEVKIFCLDSMLFQGVSGSFMLGFSIFKSKGDEE